ncbi:hypothetical protein OH77DRAFT_526760 [Trametes cingulata]|nr:hypothetical protein OH77DRAFT_526760 [Trametes cingulata]
MASSSYHANMIQFPRLPSVPESWDTSRDEPLLPPARPRNMHDARTLKTSRSSESLTQRKDRVEFLRRREWTRRVATGGDLPSSIPKRARTYSWEDIIAAADAAADSWDYYSAPRRAPAARSYPDTIDEAEDEPYVIYTATPNPRPHASGAIRPPRAVSSNHYTPHTPEPLVLYSTSPSPSHSPAPSPSPTLSPLPARGSSPPSSFVPPGGAYVGRRGVGGWRVGPHSRHSSLSSISEEDEGLARF